MTADPAPAPAQQRILVATDFSPCSRPAVEYAASLATRLGARIDVLYVSETPAVLFGDAVVLGDRFVDADIKEGRARLAHLLDELRGRGITADGQVVTGFAPDVILEQARRHDLVILGTHGRTGFRRMWMGSVAERVVRTCPIPVLTVPRSLASQTC